MKTDQRVLTLETESPTLQKSFATFTGPSNNLKN